MSLRCNICYLDIGYSEQEIKCPRCLNPFHRDHLAAWLLTEKSCPTCRQELSTVFRKDLMPKNQTERDKLQEISRNLNMIGKMRRFDLCIGALAFSTTLNKARVTAPD